MTQSPPIVAAWPEAASSCLTNKQNHNEKTHSGSTREEEGKNRRTKKKKQKKRPHKRLPIPSFSSHLPQLKKEPTIESSPPLPSASTTPDWHVYCELEHVLATAMTTQSHGKTKKQKTRHRQLTWTADGQELWNKLWPTRAVSVLATYHWHYHQSNSSYQWCWNHLGVHVRRERYNRQHLQIVPLSRIVYQHDQYCSSSDSEDENETEDDLSAQRPLSPPSVNQGWTVISCWKQHKHLYSGPGRILIDAQQESKAEWEAQGGTFVHHVSAKDTWQQLQRLGVVTTDFETRPGGSNIL